MAIDLERHLNPRQLEAVETVDGALLVLAGAGSGKTRVITYRVLHMIDNLGIRPESILAVTFTNKAADQMKTRVRERLPAGRSADPWISTFHSLCVRLLRREIEALGYGRDFAIYDADDQVKVIRELLKSAGMDSVKPRRIQSRIGWAKNRGIAPGAMADHAFRAEDEAVVRVYADYESRLRADNALDFDDLLIKTVELFEKFPDTAARYGERFRYLMVDEYQDTNRAQYALIGHLARPHGNVCVVGDEDQSIYGWRGAEIQNILDFEKDYPDARTIRLEQNYRSTRTILAAAGAVVAHNRMRKGKQLWTENPQGSKIRYFEGHDPGHEAAFVAERVLRRRRREPDARIAVLYRTNFLSRTLEEVFRRFDIPYQVVGGFSFYERAEVKDILSYLAAAVNPRDSVRLGRIINTPPRGIGRTTTDALQSWARAHHASLWDAVAGVADDSAAPARSRRALAAFRTLIEELTASAAEGIRTVELIRQVIEKTGYVTALEDEATEEAGNRIDNLRELANAAEEGAQRGESLRDFLDNAALVSDQDAWDETARVTLMTLHTAKGLEFPTVFIVGLEDGLFPHARSIGDDGDVEEERRLFYVGMTRAQERLYLTCARARRVFGSEDAAVTAVSRFLREIPPDLVDALSEPSFSEPAARMRGGYTGRSYDTTEAVRSVLDTRARTAPRSGAWKPGAKVRHAKFGLGTVLGIVGEGDDAKLTVSFNNHGLKKLIAKYATLEPA